MRIIVGEESVETLVNDLLDDRSSLMKEINDIGRICPWLVECMLHERNKYMVLELEQVCDMWGVTYGKNLHFA